MESREILIANTKTQRRSKITTDATTLGELKSALNAAGIDYSGMTFTEGISKTQLLDNNTQLPQNVMFKGQPTNNLVILLTNTKKNIASGIHAADRQAAYSIIKDYGFQEDIKAVFGRNFTQVPTIDLQKFIEDRTEVEVPSEANGGSDYDEDADEAYNNASYDLDEFMDHCRPNFTGKTLVRHITALAREGVLNVTALENIKADIDTVIGLLQAVEETPSEPVSTSDGNITDDDIDDMINGLCD